jgi:hypothetical protein
VSSRLVHNPAPEISIFGRPARSLLNVTSCPPCGKAWQPGVGGTLERFIDEFVTEMLPLENQPRGQAIGRG